MKSTSLRLGRSGLALFLLAGLSAVGCSASTGEESQSTDSAMSVNPILPKPGPVTPIGTIPNNGPAGCTTPSAITDLGYPGFRVYADANGDGYQDYCRMVGDAPNIFLSCQLGCRFGNYGVSTGFNSIQGIDQGYSGTGQMIDINGDKRADFCRTVGNPPSTFSSCDLADASGFDADAYEVSFPVGFSPSAPVTNVAAADGTRIYAYKGPNAMWFYGKDAAGVKHSMTLGTSGNYATMSIAENGASIVSLAFTADEAGYVTIYGKTPTFSKSYKFFASSANFNSSSFVTDFGAALQHFGYFQSIGTSIQSNMATYMQSMGILPGTPADQAGNRAVSAGLWTALGFMGTEAVGTVLTGGYLLVVQGAIFTLSAAGLVLSDIRITSEPVPTPNVSDQPPVPTPGTDTPPPSTTCDSTVQSCASPPPTGTGPGDDGTGDGTGGDQGGGGGGQCTPNVPNYQARHAQWAQKHPADICDTCCDE